MAANWQHRVDLAEEADGEPLRALLQGCGVDVVGVLAPGSRWLIARDHDAVVGAAGVELEHGAALLRSVAVSPERRGGGLGRALVTRALNLARESGARAAYLFSTGAGPYFARVGFREVAVGELVAALPHAPQPRRFAELGWLDSEVVWRMDLDAVV
jgi:N-acetylglutamate synthase-like GNAT family acetyltransferase